MLNKSLKQKHLAMDNKEVHFLTPLALVRFFLYLCCKTRQRLQIKCPLHSNNEEISINKRSCPFLDIRYASKKYCVWQHMNMVMSLPTQPVALKVSRGL